MNVNEEIRKEVSGLLSPSCGLRVNLRMQKVLGILDECGLLYSHVLPPALFLVHPSNRGGTMLNGHNVHRKGLEIMDSGVKPELLPANSLAIEIPLEATLKEVQFTANKKMVETAQGLLATVRGDERYLTLANSHFVQWCKAMEGGCKAADGSPLVVTPDMKPLLKDGWAWKIIKAEAERTWPTLPAFLAMAMNSHNTNQIASNELECMMQLASLYEGGMQMDQAVLAVQHSAPACKGYLEDVAYFCKFYGGGIGFPLLQCLDQFCS